MGYRSDVLSAVVFEDAAHNTTAMVAWKLHCAAENRTCPMEKDTFGENITFPKVGEHPCILLQGQGWKWYDSYPDVLAWKYFVEWMHEKHDAVTVFIRIGEETNDIEEKFTDSERGKLEGFYACDYFGVTCQIRCDI